MTGDPQALQRYALAVTSHLALVVAWYLFVKLGEVPKFVMPSPYDTLQALLVPNYRWLENIAVTTTEIFGGYILAVVFGIGAALLFSWFRWLEMVVMPLLVSLNMIPKVALGPLIIVWFAYGIGPNAVMAFAICFFPIVLTTARGLHEVEPDLLDLVRTLKGSRWQLFTKIQPACAVCHTLQAAGAEGQVGPVLDELKPDAGRVLRALKAGIGVMPSYAERMSEKDMLAVAQFVAHATGAPK